MWDEGYFLHCEDLDWCMRFRLKSWRVVFVPDAKVIHVWGACSRSRPFFVEWHKHHGMLRFYNKFFRKQYSGPLWWLVVLGVWLHFSLMSAYFAAQLVLAQIKGTVKGGAALYRRQAFIDCGGFDERFFCYVEDVDLGFRLRLAGYGCRYVPTAIVHHIGSALTGRRSDFAVYYGHRNLVFNFVKNMPWPLFWGLLPLHVLLNVLSLAVAFVLGRADPVWRAKRDALRALPAVWLARRCVQTTRRASSLAILRYLKWSLL